MLSKMEVVDAGQFPRRSDSTGTAAMLAASQIAPLHVPCCTRSKSCVDPHPCQSIAAAAPSQKTTAQSFAEVQGLYMCADAPLLHHETQQGGQVHEVLVHLSSAGTCFPCCIER